MSHQKRLRTRLAIDANTGEILHNAVTLNPGDVYLTKEEAEKRRMYAELKNAKKRFHHGREYVVSYIDTVREITDKLTLGEAGGLVKLLLHLRINSDGAIIYKGKPAKKIDLARIMGVSKPTAYKYVKKFAEVGVLTEAAEAYVINKRFHSMGWVGEGSFTKLYTVKARKIISRLSNEEIGMLYNFLPYFHYLEYYLCENPDCDPDDIEYIGPVRLAELIGIDRKLVWERMKRLQKAGAVLITGTRNQTRYLVHPDLMFRQPEGTETEWTRSVRKLFEDHEKRRKR